MITGAHVIIYSTDPENDRIFLRDIMKFPNVDAGDGRLIFGLPPAEVAVHPSEMNNGHEFFLMCDDIEELIELVQETIRREANVVLEREVRIVGEA